MELYKFLVYRLTGREYNSWQNRLYNNNTVTREAATMKKSNLVSFENPEENTVPFNTKNSKIDHSSNWAVLIVLLSSHLDMSDDHWLPIKNTNDNYFSNSKIIQVT